MEHFGRFIAQCKEVACEDALKVRFFPLSFSGSAFTWFASLPPNSILDWPDLEKKFHAYFYTSMHEMKISDFTSLRQRNSELARDFIQRFRETRNRCCSVSLSDSQLTDLAFQGLLPSIKERFAGQDFDNLAQLAQKASAVEG